MFVDKVEILVKAGRGGNGLVSFRREKFVDKGGPDGGNGGNGGNIIFVGDPGLNTLAKFRHNKRIQAENGENGKRKKQHGRNGLDVKVTVPLGTVVYENGSQIADITQPKEEAIVAQGGRGGFGNAHFTSSTRRVPRVAEKGEPGEEKRLILELKILAEVGLIGLPNAGKSTLLSVISNARPEIADYPFTTLSPNLGVVDVGKHSLLFADIPGLIEGASQGKGLGDEFLRHIERTKTLIHLVDSTNEDIESNYNVIQNELQSYKIDLTQKPQIAVLSKIDAIDQTKLNQKRKDLRAVHGSSVYAISSKTKEGISELIMRILKEVTKARKIKEDKNESDDIFIHVLENTDDAWEIKRVKQGFYISGVKIEKFALRTDFENPFGVTRLKDIMQKMGIIHELERRDMKNTDKVFIGGTVESPKGMLSYEDIF